MMRQTASYRIHSICTLSLLAVLAAGGPVVAAMQVHVSTDNYYANGTSVSVSYDIFGATDFSVGETRGEILWEVTEKAWWDEPANQTIISYTVFNDSFATDITSLHVPVPAGIAALSVSAPVGWTGAQVGNEIVWQTPGPGIPLFQSLDTMIVKYAGLHAIGFLPNVMVDFADQTAMTNINWVVTSVPEPATFALLTLGVLVVKRRR
jgi:hypothetical protein